MREYWEWIQKTKDPHMRESFHIDPQRWADALAWALNQMEEARREARELRLRLEDLEARFTERFILMASSPLRFGR